MADVFGLALSEAGGKVRSANAGPSSLALALDRLPLLRGPVRLS